MVILYFLQNLWQNSKKMIKSFVVFRKIIIFAPEPREDIRINEIDYSKLMYFLHIGSLYL